MTLEQLNIYITGDFDRYVLPEYIEGMLKYNANDCYIVIEIARLNPVDKPAESESLESG